MKQAATRAGSLPTRLVTQGDVDELQAEIVTADAQMRRWTAIAGDLRLIHQTLRSYVGKPFTDLRAGLAQVEADIATAKAEVVTRREHMRDLEGFIRIIRESAESRNRVTKEDENGTS